MLLRLLRWKILNLASIKINFYRMLSNRKWGCAGEYKTCGGRNLIFVTIFIVHIQLCTQIDLNISNMQFSFAFLAKITTDRVVIVLEKDLIWRFLWRKGGLVWKKAFGTALLFTDIGWFFLIFIAIPIAIGRLNICSPEINQKTNLQSSLILSYSVDCTRLELLATNISLRCSE